MRGPLRVVRLEPLPEQMLNLVGQPQQDIARPARAALRGSFENRLELVIIERGDHRRRHHYGRYPRRVQLGKRTQPCLRRGGARLHRALQVSVESRDTDGNARQPIASHLRQQLEVAQHERALGDDRDRVARARQHLEDRSRDAHAPLDGLVGIGVGAESYGLADVPGLCELRFQHSRRILLVEQTSLEIDSGRQTHVGMARARVAITATMTAAPIRVDRLLERDIGRVVGADHFARAVGLERCLDALGYLVLIPTVIDRFDLLTLETAGRVGKSPEILQGLVAWTVAAHTLLYTYTHSESKDPCKSGI